MTIAIVIVSIIIGFLLGYKVGYRRCVKQFSVVLQVLRKQLAEYGISLSALPRK